MAEVNGRTKV